MISKEIEKGTNHIYCSDKKMAALIDRIGICGLKPKRGYYAALLRAIVGQQLSVLAAASIYNKFLIGFEGDPAPEKILDTPHDVLRSYGLSNAKVKYVKDLSAHIINRQIDFKGVNKKSDEVIISELTAVKGIGEWTVHMFLIFTLNRLDVLPTADLGLRKAVKNVYNLRKLPDYKRLKRISSANGWAPYNSIASWYLWRSLEID